MPKCSYVRANFYCICIRSVDAWPFLLTGQFQGFVPQHRRLREKAGSVIKWGKIYSDSELMRLDLFHDLDDDFTRAYYKYSMYCILRNCVFGFNFVVI